MSEHPRLEVQLERLGRGPEHYRELRACADVPTMLARTAELARECGWARGLCVTPQDGVLTAAGSEALADPASDRLRRALQHAPVPLALRGLENELLRGQPASRRPSRLAEALELQAPELAPIGPDGRVLALLVVDQPEAGAADDLDRAALGALATMAGAALERLLQRARIDDLSAGVRHMSSTLQALMAEASDAPLVLPRARGVSYVFPRDRPVPADRDGLLSQREHQVAALLVEGRTNPEIARQLMLSTETVKDHVARIRQKLRAANRVEAASRYTQLSQRRPAAG